MFKLIWMFKQLKQISDVGRWSQSHTYEAAGLLANRQTNQAKKNSNSQQRPAYRMRRDEPQHNRPTNRPTDSNSWHNNHGRHPISESCDCFYLHSFTHSSVLLLLLLHHYCFPTWSFSSSNLRYRRNFTDCLPYGRRRSTLSEDK